MASDNIPDTQPDSRDFYCPTCNSLIKWSGWVECPNQNDGKHPDWRDNYKDKPETD